MARAREEGISDVIDVEAEGRAWVQRRSAWYRGHSGQPVMRIRPFARSMNTYRGRSCLLHRVRYAMTYLHPPAAYWGNANTFSMRMSVTLLCGMSLNGAALFDEPPRGPICCKCFGWPARPGEFGVEAAEPLNGGSEA